MGPGRICLGYNDNQERGTVINISTRTCGGTFGRPRLDQLLMGLRYREKYNHKMSDIRVGDGE
jgi:hypothetical protein